MTVPTRRPPDLYVKDTTTTYEPIVRDPSGFEMVSPDDPLIIDNGQSPSCPYSSESTRKSDRRPIHCIPYDKQAHAPSERASHPTSTPI